ncbi:MAG: flagellar export protein FliJ [Pirellulales bacterium]
MKPFEFRLTTLLKLREAVRDERRARLAEAFQAAEVLQRRLTELSAQRTALRSQYAAATSPGQVAVNQLLDVQRYELVVAGEQQLLTGQQQQIEEEIDKRRDALRLADQEVRILEKLREKQQRDHRVGAEKEEAKGFDEIASRAAAIRRIEGVAAFSESAGGEA